MRNPAFKAMSSRGSYGSRCKVVKKATSYREEGNSVIFTLYHTPIVTVRKHEIILNHGGYMTVTTKRRMNEISQELGLKYGVHQSKGKWYVYYMGFDVAFEGNKIRLYR